MIILLSHRCNILIHSHFSVHKRDVHKYLCTPLGCTVHHLAYTTQGVYRSARGRYICTCGWLNIMQVKMLHRVLQSKTCLKFYSRRRLFTCSGWSKNRWWNDLKSQRNKTSMESRYNFKRWKMSSVSDEASEFWPTENNDILNKEPACVGSWKWG